MIPRTPVGPPARNSSRAPSIPSTGLELSDLQRRPEPSRALVLVVSLALVTISGLATLGVSQLDTTEAPRLSELPLGWVRPGASPSHAAAAFEFARVDPDDLEQLEQLRRLGYVIVSLEIDLETGQVVRAAAATEARIVSEPR